MFGYMSDFCFVPERGIGGVILTNADSGWGVAGAVMRRTLEIIYDGKPEAEEDFVSSIAELKAFQKDVQKLWVVPPDPKEVKRLAAKYHNAALGDIVVRSEADGVVFQFGGWKSRMASKPNPDGTTSFLSIDAGVIGFEFNAPASKGKYTKLELRDSQHTYEYEAVAAVKD